MDAGEPLQVELLCNRGHDMLTGSGQVTGLFAVRRGQQRQGLVAIELGRVGVYHFIHLTFQEYFAARYFVRQWKERA